MSFEEWASNLNLAGKYGLVGASTGFVAPIFYYSLASSFPNTTEKLAFSLATSTAIGAIIGSSIGFKKMVTNERSPSLL